MVHVRQELRDAVTAMLTGLPSLGSRVKQNRATPLAKASPISLAVRTPSEISADDTMGGGQQRHLTVRCDLTAKGSDEQAVADALDAAAVEIEKAFAADQTIGSRAESYQYRGATMVILDEGEKLLGTLSLAFELLIFTDRENPESSL